MSQFNANYNGQRFIVFLSSHFMFPWYAGLDEYVFVDMPEKMVRNLKITC